jgi:hypothetical protein
LHKQQAKRNSFQPQYPMVEAANPIEETTVNSINRQHNNQTSDETIKAMMLTRQ